MTWDTITKRAGREHHHPEKMTRDTITGKDEMGHHYQTALQIDNSGTVLWKTDVFASGSLACCIEQAKTKQTKQQLQQNRNNKNKQNKKK